MKGGSAFGVLYLPLPLFDLFAKVGPPHCQQPFELGLRARPALRVTTVS